jgi:hypothetical protein
MAQADAGIASWHSKYVYDFWRPVTAIQRGDEDGNPRTAAEADWEPLGAPGFDGHTDFTPPFPAYVSGHATFGAAVYKVLADFYHTDRMQFTLASDEMPGVARRFHRFSQAANENAISRVYMGVHWIFDADAGQHMGRTVGDVAFDTQLAPVRHGPGHDAGPTPVTSAHEGRGKTTAVASLASRMGLTDNNDDPLA